MKRRTSLIILGCATLGGTITTAAQPASATPNIWTGVRENPTEISAPAPRKVAVPRKVPTRVKRLRASVRKVPVRKVAVQPGDSLSAIATRVSRTWVELAAYNHIPNPDVIYPGEALLVPPANYRPGAASLATYFAPSNTGATYGASAAWDSSSVSQPSYTYAAPAAVSSPSGTWSCIAAHESGGNASTNTGNGYYGLYQDTQSSWVAGGGLAYAPRADLASSAAQTAVNQHIQAQQGWGAWPVSSAACGA